MLWKITDLPTNPNLNWLVEVTERQAVSAVRILLVNILNTLYVPASIEYADDSSQQCVWIKAYSAASITKVFSCFFPSHSIYSITNVSLCDYAITCYREGNLGKGRAHLLFASSWITFFRTGELYFPSYNLHYACKSMIWCCSVSCNLCLVPCSASAAMDGKGISKN